MTYDLDFQDPTLPEVRIRIGGKERKLAFDYKAIVTAEKVAGVNLLNDTFDASFTSLGGLLYAALLHDDPMITLDEVGSWVNFKSAPVIYQAVLSAWLGSMPAAKDETPGEAMAATETSAAASPKSSPTRGRRRDTTSE